MHSKTSNAELEVACLNKLIYIHKTNLIDQRSQYKDLDSTIDMILHKYLNPKLCIDSYSVHEAVSQCYMHLLMYCIIPKYGLDIPKINELLLEPLRVILLTGDDTVAQHGAVHCIYFLTRGAYEKDQSELFKYLYTYFLEIFIEKQLDNEEYFN